MASQRIAARREKQRQVAELQLQGWSQPEIAQHLGISQSSVSRRLKRFRSELRDATRRIVGDAWAMELERIDRIERQAWKGWQASQQGRRTAQITKNDKAGETSRTALVDQHGDPRYLRVIQQCVAERRVLWGLAPQTPSGSTHGSTISLEERVARVACVVEKLRDRDRVADDRRRIKLGEPGPVRPVDERRPLAPGEPPGAAGPGAGRGA
jgi:predicted transcriptional regulator